MNALEEGKKIKKQGIIALVLIFTLIGIIATVIMTLVGGIKVLSNDWGNEQLNKDKTLWGILCIVGLIFLLILGPISMIVFGNKVISTYGGK